MVSDVRLLYDKVFLDFMILTTAASTYPNKQHKNLHKTWSIISTQPDIAFL